MAELDDILNAALDELDDEEEEELDVEHKHSNAKHTRKEDRQEHETNGLPIQDSTGATSYGVVPQEKKDSGGAGGDDTEEKELQETITKTIDMLGKLNSGLDDPDNIFDDNFLTKLVEEFDKLGDTGGPQGSEKEGADCDSMVDNMVKQLLAKDLMYPPLKEVTKQFPSWLEKNRGKVEIAVYQRYEEQYALFEQIVLVYEKEEENMPKLLDLMTKAQEYGQPPPEIVQELLPAGGASSGSGGDDAAFLNGLMNMPGLGGGEGGAGSEACVIM